MRYSEGTGKVDYSYWLIDGKGKRQRSRNGIYINGTKKSLHRLVSGDMIRIGESIKISYSYIAYSTDSSRFLNYSNTDKAQLKSSSKQKHDKETVVLDNHFSHKDIPEDSCLIENALVKSNPSEENISVEETILYKAEDN